MRSRVGRATGHRLGGRPTSYIVLVSPQELLWLEVAGAWVRALAAFGIVCRTWLLHRRYAGHRKAREPWDRLRPLLADNMGGWHYSCVQVLGRVGGPAKWSEP